MENSNLQSIGNIARTMQFNGGYSIKTNSVLSAEKKKKWGTQGAKGPKYCRFKLQMKWRYPWNKEGREKKRIFPSFDYEETTTDGQKIRIYSEEKGLKKIMDWIKKIAHGEYHEAIIYCNMTNNLLSHLKNYRHTVYIIRDGEIKFQGLCCRFFPNGKLDIQQTYLATDDFNQKKELARREHERTMIFSSNATQLTKNFSR